MKISLIITTQGNRMTDLIRFIRSIELMIYKNVEIILVDQSEDSAILDIVRNSSIYEKTKHIKTSKVSLSKARNMGLAEATGDILCFPDDDCWYSENIIDQVVKLFKEQNSYDCICTNVYDPNEEKFYGTRRKNGNDEIKINQINAFKYPISVGIFLRSRVMGDLLFDERLGAGAKWGSGEETDLVLKLLKKDAKIVFCPNILVYHPVGNDINWDRAKYYNYGKGFGATIQISLQRRQFLTLIELLIILSRSFAAFILFGIKDRRKSLNYLARIRGIFKGLTSVI